MRRALSVYIGGSSLTSEIQRTKRNTLALESINQRVIVTSTWWKHVESAGQSNGVDLSLNEQFAYSYCDISEVDAATWLWVQMPPLGLISAGAFFEFGYAYRADKRILVSGPGQHASIFTSMADIRCETDEEAIEFFKKIA